jgi:hypothetical protein
VGAADSRASPTHPPQTGNVQMEGPPPTARTLNGPDNGVAFGHEGTETFDCLGGDVNSMCKFRDEPGGRYVDKRAHHRH